MEKKLKIQGLEFFPIKVFENEKGKLFHHVRSDSPYFAQFGEIYYSMTYAGVIKGWKLHHEVTQIFVVPIGSVRILLYDLREGSPTHGCHDLVDLGHDVGNYGALKIPPGLLYAFGTLGEATSLVANQISMPHRPEESTNYPLETYFKDNFNQIWGGQ